jgi:hypothetical protein
MLLFRIVLRRPRQLVISNRRPEIDRKVYCRPTALLLVLTLDHLSPTAAGNRVDHPLAVGVGCPAPAQVRQEQERVLLQRIIDYIASFRNEADHRDCCYSQQPTAGAVRASSPLRARKDTFLVMALSRSHLRSRVDKP